MDAEVSDPLAGSSPGHELVSLTDGCLLPYQEGTVVEMKVRVGTQVHSLE